MDYEAKNYVVFRRMSKHLIPGFSARMVACVAAGALVGALLFALLSLPQTKGEEFLGYEERITRTEELTHMQDALKYEEAFLLARKTGQGMDEVLSMREEKLPGASDEEIAELAEKAHEAGVKVDASAAEIDALVGVTHIVDTPLVPGIWRFLMAMVPIGVAVALTMEFSGASVFSEIRQERLRRQEPCLYVYESRRR